MANLRLFERRFPALFRRYQRRNRVDGLEFLFFFRVEPVRAYGSARSTNRLTLQAPGVGAAGAGLESTATEMAATGSNTIEIAETQR